MRTPTTMAYEEWSRAVANGVPVAANSPQPGWYLRKDAPGVMTPARIWLEQPTDPETGELIGDEVLVCEIAGEFSDPEEAWAYIAKRPIPEDEFHWRMAELFGEQF